MKPRVFILALLAVAWMAAPAGAADYTITKDVIYGHKAGMALTLDVVQPAENGNGVGLLYMVSGGWVSNYFDIEQGLRDSGNQRGRFATILDGGFTLFMVRHGSSPYFKVPDAVADVRRAVRYIRHNAGDYGVDPDRLGVFGGSAGGHLSLVLGTTSDAGDPDSDDPIKRASSRVACVVAYFPPVDLRSFVGQNDRFPALDFSEELAASVSPILHVTEDDAPALMIHGDKDELVPINHSERIYAAFQEAGVPTEFIVMEGAAHGFRGKHGSDAAAALTDWFQRHLVLQHTD